MNIKDTLKKKLQSIVETDIDIIIETPKDPKNGDYSTNVAMQLTKTLHNSPLNIAKNIVEKLKEDSTIEKIEIAGPGFINFYMNKSYLLENINTVLAAKENYGKQPNNNTKINVEFVSANPTGLLHVGTSRGAAYGDNLCRILDFAGYDVTREYYFNDGGVQIENLGKSLKARYKTLTGIKEDIPEGGYHGHEIIEIAQKLYDKEKDTKIDESIEYFSKFATNILIQIIKKDLKDFRVSFDVWTSEQDIRNSGNVEKCLEILDKHDNIYEHEGAKWLKTTKYGDDKDRVIIKSDGNYTYLVPDIAYHLDKINRGYDEIVDVLGADHHGYISRLKASIEALGYNKDKIHIKLLQMVKLLRDGLEVKMSKRTGLTVTMRELMEEVGVDAARYFFAARSLDSQLDFDIDLAKKQSNENPVYYAQYAHARICSILREAENKNILPAQTFETIQSDAAYDTLKKIYEFNETIQISAQKKLPHLIASYVYEVASLFHAYYAKEKILTDNKQYSQERIALITAIKITIQNALSLIGVTAPNKM